MDQETLYTASKWEILKHLEGTARSPLEIANITGLSLANISQQLRLLEMAGLVTSQRVPNRERGQPRILYRIAGDSCYVISTSNDLVAKRRLEFSLSNKIVMRIWFLEDPELRALCEKAFWRVEDNLPEIKALFVDTHSTNPLCMYLVPAAGRLPIEEIQETRLNGKRRKLIITQLDEAKLQQIKEEATLSPLYDPENIA